MQSQNLYAFVGNQPHMNTDPMGQCLGLDNLPCIDWYNAWNEAQVKTAVTVAKGAAHGVVKTADFATMGQVSGAAVRIGTFMGSGGTLNQRAAAANAAGNQHSANVATLGFSSAPDKLQHARNLVGGALGVDAQRQGSAMAFEGIIEGDADKAIRGGAQWLGGASQTVLTIAGIGQGAEVATGTPGTRLFAGAPEGPVAPSVSSAIEPAGIPQPPVNPQQYSVAFETRLSPQSYPGLSRARHFQEANESLLTTMESNPEFAQTMSDLGINLERTPNGLASRQSPAGWTWHHADEPGLMQLVPRPQHSWGSSWWDTLHPDGKGGYAIWGKP